MTGCHGTSKFEIRYSVWQRR